MAEYSYDPLGRRVSKTLPDGKVSYLYAGQKIIEETVTDLSGNVLRASGFAYGTDGDDDVLAEFRTQSGTTASLFFAKDRLGSTAAVSDGSGSVLEEYRHSAFGNTYRKLGDGSWEALGTETETLSGTVRPEPITDRLYTGREWDSETGLHYYRARTYSPELGRFLQRDPVGAADQVNPYAYVRNNPLTWTDPTGMVCEEALGKLMRKDNHKAVLQNIVRHLNSTGPRMERTKNSSRSIAELGASYVVLTQGYGIPSENIGLGDLNIEANLAVRSETMNGSDIKNDYEYQALSDNSKECYDSGEEIGCYLELENGSKAYLADIGNMALFYNGAKAGLSYEYLESMAYVKTLSAAKNPELNSFNTREQLVNAVENNEREDRTFYRYGYAMGLHTQTGNLSELQFKKYLISAEMAVNR